MNESEILQPRSDSPQECFYIEKTGSHYQACGCAAFALARLLHRSVRPYLRANRETDYMLRIPLAELETVILKMSEAGWTCKICKDDASLISFRGADGTPDAALVEEDGETACREAETIRDSIVSEEPRNAVHLYETLLKDLPEKDKLKLIILLAASIDSDRE